VRLRGPLQNRHDGLESLIIWKTLSGSGLDGLELTGTTRPASTTIVCQRAYFTSETENRQAPIARPAGREVDERYPIGPYPTLRPVRAVTSDQCSGGVDLLRRPGWQRGWLCHRTGESGSVDHDSPAGWQT